MLTVKQSPIQLEIRCECGNLEWILLEQLKLSDGQFYCRICQKIYKIDIGNSKKVKDLEDIDLDFVRRMLKNQSFTSGEIENMIAGVFEKGLEFTNREELLKECLSCYQT